jgi:hypothetical protein
MIFKKTSSSSHNFTLRIFAYQIFTDTKNTMEETSVFINAFENHPHLKAA